METIRAALLALYLPIVLLATAASLVYAKDVLVPAIRRREFALRNHGLAVCLVVSLGSDAAENAYWGAHRLLAMAYSTQYYPPILGVSAIKLSILFSSIVALATYCEITGKSYVRVIGAALMLWAAGFMAITGGIFP